MATVNNGREHGQSGIKGREEIWTVSNKPAYVLILIHYSNFIFTNKDPQTDRIHSLNEVNCTTEFDFM
ncbi:hypothetical protein E5AUHO_00370 [Citrobacter freundii]|nr:hypothetical protein E5AUHO_00370 [Citrobacter freundii]